MRIRTGRPAMELILVAALVLAGCGQSENRKVATAQPEVGVSGSAPASPLQVKESNFDRGVRFARCMTQKGFRVKDPVEGQPFDTYIDLPFYFEDPARNAGEPHIKAFENCKQFLPPTWPVKVDPKDIEYERKFGECLRKRGQYWPEPGEDGTMDYMLGDPAQGTKEYKAAFEACVPLLNDPAQNANQG